MAGLRPVPLGCGWERPNWSTKLLAEISAHPRLTDHAGDGWHIHYRDSGPRLGAVLRALIRVGTAPHLSGLLPRLRQPRRRPPPPATTRDDAGLTYS